MTEGHYERMRYCDLLGLDLPEPSITPWMRRDGRKPIANSVDSVVSMVAAGRGIFVSPLIGYSDRFPTVNCYVRDA